MENIVINKKSERNSSFELLRIISMLLIIFHHFSVHGKFIFLGTDSSLNRFWLDFMLLGGKLGVNLFVLISGYFLINKEGPLFNIKKLLKLWGQMFFYSVLIYFIFVLFLDVPFSFSSLFPHLIPVLSKSWWFASTYFVLFLLHPFINMLLTRINKSTYQIILLLLVIIWSIIPTILSRDFEGNNLTWFITLYVVAGYIRLYGFNPKFKRHHFLLMFVIVTSITFLSTIVMVLLSNKLPVLQYYSTYLYSQNKLSIFLMSVTLFMVFVHTNIKTNKLINLISSTTFGIYLIHDSNFIRPFLWETLFKNATLQYSYWLIPYSIGVCLLVFMTCFIIDLIRIKTINKVYLRFLDKYIDTLTKPFRVIFSKVTTLLFGKE